MSKRRTILGIAVFSVLHFVAMGIAMLAYMALADSRWETNRPESPLEGIAWTFATIFMFPGYRIAMSLGTGNDALEWLMVIGNSLLWGTGLFFVFLDVRRRILVGRFSVHQLLMLATLIALLLGLLVWVEQLRHR